MKTLGVIGGMGPAATFDFCARLTAAMPVARDQDHPRILVDCDPHVPDRNAAQRGEGPSPGAYIAAMARGLRAAGAEVLAMPCNTAHAYRAEIEAAAPGPFVDIIAATTEAALVQRPQCVGVLAVDGCLGAGLYQQALTARGAPHVVLAAPAQAAFMQTIYAIKAGRRGAAEQAAMRSAVADLVRAGAETIIAGCTEIGLVLAADAAEAPLIDSLDALVAATIVRLQT